MFKLKQPCKDCPFVKGSNTDLTLEPGRMKEIVESLYVDKTFNCHKTINYEGGEARITVDSQFCAGALLYMERDGVQNTPMQVAYRLRFYHPEKMKGQEKLIDPLHNVEKGWYRRNGRVIESVN